MSNALVKSRNIPQEWLQSSIFEHNTFHAILCIIDKIQKAIIAFWILSIIQRIAWPLLCLALNPYWFSNMTMFFSKNLNALFYTSFSKSSLKTEMSITKSNSPWNADADIGHCLLGILTPAQCQMGRVMRKGPGRHILSIFSFKLFGPHRSPNNMMEVIKVEK